MDKYDKLRNLTKNDIGPFSLLNRTTTGKIIDIYGPNMCKMIICMNNVMFSFNCKLKNTSVVPKNNFINELINFTTDCTYDTNVELTKLPIDMIKYNKKLLSVLCGEFDTDGNLLVDLYEPNTDNKTSINTQLIDIGYLTKIFHLPEELFKFNTMI